MPSVTLISRERLPQVPAEAARQPAVLISAGWQESEARDDSVVEAWPERVENLALYERAMRVRDRDPALSAALHDKQAKLLELQAGYRIRLKHAVAAVDQLERRHESTDRQSLRDAYASLRALDRRHLQRARAIHSEPLPDSTALEEERASVAEQLHDCTVVLLAGGHVAVLRNRMRLFGLDTLLAEKCVIAWGAGAMACADRVVLFLEHSPRGRREPEIVDSGLALAQRVVVIPEARQRLQLNDLQRCASLCARFAPARCVSLDGNAMLTMAGRRVVAAQDVFRLTQSGRAGRVRQS